MTRRRKLDVGARLAHFAHWRAWQYSMVQQQGSLRLIALCWALRIHGNCLHFAPRRQYCFVCVFVCVRENSRRSPILSENDKDRHNLPYQTLILERTKCTRVIYAFYLQHAMDAGKCKILPVFATCVLLRPLCTVRFGVQSETAHVVIAVALMMLPSKQTALSDGFNSSGRLQFRLCLRFARCAMWAQRRHTCCVTPPPPSCTAAAFLARQDKLGRMKPNSRKFVLTEIVTPPFNNIYSSNWKGPPRGLRDFWLLYKTPEYWTPCKFLCGGSILKNLIHPPNCCYFVLWMSKIM